LQQRVFGTECEYALLYSAKHEESRALYETDSATHVHGTERLIFSTRIHPDTMLPQ